MIRELYKPSFLNNIGTLYLFTSAFYFTITSLFLFLDLTRINILVDNMIDQVIISFHNIFSLSA